MDYFIPKTGSIMQPNGKSMRLTRGIHEVPDAVADSKAAIAYGIKPKEEMTDAEWRSTGHKKPETKKAAALDGAVAKPSTPPAALDGKVSSKS